MNLSTTTQQTMLSTEIVKIINDMREEGAAELRHDTFMAKVAKVLGEAAQNFLASYKGKDGTTRKCYALPKREANLMVMSESYAVQAAVYDRMVELEQQALEGQVIAKVALIEQNPKAEALRLSPSAYDAAMVFCCGNVDQARRVADRAIHRTTGVSPLDLLGIEIVSQHTCYLSPLELGEPIDLTAHQMNLKLAKSGLQFKDERDIWTPTESGEKYACWIESEKKKDGAPLLVLKWDIDVMNVLK